MLILTRKAQQAIVIPITEYLQGQASEGKTLQDIIDESPEIKITVALVKGENVRLGFDAPKAIPVHRQEVFQTILAERNKTSVPAA